MKAVPDHFEHPQDAAEFKRPARAGIELYRARIVHHAFDPHTHEAFGLGAIESGVERFRYRGGDHLAPPDTLVLMNPDELHTGRAETEHGWRYRMLYLDAELLTQVTGERGWHFAQPTVHDVRTARRVGRLLAAMWNAPDALAIDSALVDLLEMLRPHAHTGTTRSASAITRPDAALARVHALIQARYAEPLTLEQLAHEAGLSPFHFLRRFKQRYHVTPHQMVMAVRLFRAKQQLAAGVSPAHVAADVGLVDQPHLTRRFARMYGVTPARYQAQVNRRNCVQDRCRRPEPHSAA
ncbi:MAG: AraC family transcriptional regulator [Rhizobacter sp.]|nr:AraC family transcriptional regulator [Rhizobacter sp.]